jgi:hypothetical protein
MANERFQVRRRENSNHFPYAIIDTLTDKRAVALATTPSNAEEEAKRRNALAEFHVA